MVTYNANILKTKKNNGKKYNVLAFKCSGRGLVLYTTSGNSGNLTDMNDTQVIRLNEPSENQI